MKAGERFSAIFSIGSCSFAEFGVTAIERITHIAIRERIMQPKNVPTNADFLFLTLSPTGQRTPIEQSKLYDAKVTAPISQFGIRGLNLVLTGKLIPDLYELKNVIIPTKIVSTARNGTA